MKPEDILNPRVFLCKTSRFLDNFVNKNMQKDTKVKKERFGTKEFEESCEEKDLETLHHSLNDDDSGSGSGDCSEFEDPEADAEIIQLSGCKKEVRFQAYLVQLAIFC